MVTGPYVLTVRSAWIFFFFKSRCNTTQKYPSMSSDPGSPSTYETTEEGELCDTNQSQAAELFPGE